MPGPKLFLGNLPSEVGVSDIEHFLQGYGQINDILLKEGYAIVILSDPLDAEQAISDLNGKTLFNNRINVEKTNGWQKRERLESRKERKQVIRTSHRVFIKNLSSRVSWQDLKDYMSTVSQPTFVDAHKKCKNGGMVEFSTYEDMNRAIAQLDGTELDGRVIRMQPDNRMRGGRQYEYSPEYNRYTKRKRSKSPGVSRRCYARESMRFHPCCCRPRSQSRSPSRHRSVERQTFHSRFQSTSFYGPKSSLEAPGPESVEPQAA